MELSIRWSVKESLTMNYILGSILTKFIEEISKTQLIRKNPIGRLSIICGKIKHCQTYKRKKQYYDVYNYKTSETNSRGKLIFYIIAATRYYVKLYIFTTCLFIGRK